MLLSHLAQIVNSQVVNLKQDVEITGITTLENAAAGEVSFVSDKKYFGKINECNASAILVPEGTELSDDKTYIPVKHVWTAVLELLKQLNPNYLRKTYTGIHPTAQIDPTAKLGENVVVSPNAVVGPDCQIGDNVYIGPGCVLGEKCIVGTGAILYANVVIESETELGAGVIVQPGAVLGADGFKYEVIAGQWVKIPQVGVVRIADNAEIGANTCIDRASYTATVVGPNTKIDNLVQIAHNAEIGSNCVIVSQTGIAGSTTIGNGCILAAQVGIADNLKIGDGVVIFAKSGVKDNLESGGAVFGTPAKPFRQEAKILALLNKLPELSQEVTRLTKRIKELEAQLETLTKE